nr:CRISPR-associated endonuclease Cas1 [Desulforadius tongensis]
MPVSALAEILYCPRNFYYRVMEAAEDSNAHVLEGRLQEERRSSRERVIRENSLQVRSIMLASEKLGLIGVVDAVEERKTGVLYPVEYKKGKMGDNINDDVQLCAQAMLLEEKLGAGIERGFVYYAGSHARREVYLSSDLRELVVQTIDRARGMIETGEIPPPLGDNRCRGCALEERCLPDETRYLKGTGLRPKRPVPGANLGRVLYVDDPGAYVRKKGNRLVVSRQDETICDMPLCNVDQVVLVGGVNLSTPAARKLLEHGTGVSFISTRGKFQGALVPGLTRNSILRLAQYRLYFEEAKSIALSRAFVRGKLGNMRTMLLRYNRDLKDPAIENAVRRIAVIIKDVKSVRDKERLLGLEGAGSREYFKVLGRLIKHDITFDFTKRSRRPPQDPVNAMLSFGYTLLVKDCLTAAYVAGFDPYIGFFHRPLYGRPALALDIMEEFRPVVVDSVVLGLLNRGMMEEGNFEYNMGGCFLNRLGREKFYRAYEERRRQKITHPLFKYQLPYMRVFEMQARFLAKVIMGELDEYIPFVIR